MANGLCHRDQHVLKTSRTNEFLLELAKLKLELDTTADGQWFAKFDDLVEAIRVTYTTKQ